MRILYMSIYFSSLIIYWMFSALITSKIALLRNNLPISTYKEFLQNQEYKLTTIRESMIENSIVSFHPKLQFYFKIINAIFFCLKRKKINSF